MTTFYLNDSGSAWNTTGGLSDGNLNTGYEGYFYNYEFGYRYFSGITDFNLSLSQANDDILTGDGDDTVYGNGGNDILGVEGGTNVVDGGSGNDALSINFSGQLTGVSVDLTQGAAQQLTGAGSITGIETFGHVVGSSFGDSFIEAAVTQFANSQFETGAGNDFLLLRRGNDSVDMGTGSDRLSIDSSDSAWSTYFSTDLTGDLASGYAGVIYNYQNGTVTFSNVEHFDFDGSSADDNFTSGNGDDNLSGNAGNDRLSAGQGSDNIDGGDGNDQLSIDLSDETAGITIDLSFLGAQQTGGSGSVQGVETFGTVIGSGYGDSFIETAVTQFSNSSYSTGDGNDLVSHRRGNDTVDLGSGSDRLRIDDSDSAWSTYYSVALNGDLAAGYAGSVYNYQNGTVSFSNVEHFDFLGGSANDTFTSGNGNDNLSGNDGNDVLSAGQGNDSVSGGAGADQLSIDLSDETAGITIDLTLAGQQQTGGSGSITGMDTFGSVTGSNFADRLIDTDESYNSSSTFSTGSGNDFVHYRRGNDSIDLGTGNDRLRIDESASSWSTYYSVALSGTLGTGYAGSVYNYRNGTVSFSNVEHFDFLGGSADDTFTSGDGNDNIQGNDGNDILIVGRGNDVVNGGNGNDQLSASYTSRTSGVTIDLTQVAEQMLAGTGSIQAMESFGTIIGSNFADTFIEGGINANTSGTFNTGAGNDTVRVIVGNDTVDMGSGSDRLGIDHSGSAWSTTVSTPLTGDLASGYSGAYYNYAQGTVSFSNVENFDLSGGLANDTFVTGDGADNVNAGAGNDLLTLGRGNDVVIGGDGSDQLGIDFSDEAAGVTVDLRLGGEQQSGGSGSISGVESFGTVSGSAFDDVFIESDTSTNTSSTFAAGAGNDLVRVSRGNDSVDGGSGNDRLIVDYSGSGWQVSLSVALTGSLASGYAGSWYNYANGTIAFANVENFDILGGSANDTIITGDGADLLDGGAGADALTGAGGDDTYVVDNAGDSITEDSGNGTDTVRTALASYALGANLENLTGLSGAGQTLTGNTLDNALTGGDGNDTLSGGEGNDRLTGGGGSDTATYADATGGVAVSLSIIGSQAVGGGAGSDRLSLIENLIGSGFGDTLLGNGVANVLSGLDGNDVLRGLVGADTLNGGTGDDTLWGGGDNDTLLGGDGNDTLHGDAGVDAMTGGTGDDTYYVDNLADTVTEDAGAGDDIVFSKVSLTLGDNVERLTFLSGVSGLTGTGNALDNRLVGNATADTLYGLNGADTLIGNDGADKLFGGAGSDTLIGGAGKDEMTGGTNRDYFRFVDLADMKLTTATADVIHDFSQAETDRIQLNLIDANTTTATANEAFIFIGTSAFSSVAGQLRYQQIAGNTYVSGDVNGDAAADFFIRIDGAVALVAGDFVL